MKNACIMDFCIHSVVHGINYRDQSVCKRGGGSLVRILILAVYFTYEELEIRKKKDCIPVYGNTFGFCPNSFHILASLTIRCLRSLRSDTNFLKLKRRRIIYDQNCHICKIVSTEDLQYVQCISILVRGESGDSHLYQQGPNGGP